MKKIKERWTSRSNEFSYFKYGSHALLVQFRKSRSRTTLSKIINLENQIANEQIDGIEEMVPGYHSLMIYFKPRIIDHDTLIERIESRDRSITVPEGLSKIHTINVNYDESFAPDLKHVASHLNLSEQEVIDIHSQPIYDVHFIGFLPGFLYLGGLSKKLNIPRRDTPRVRVPAGSVAIASGQTGIYPIESPGGWHIIGRTEEELFNPMRDPPCQFKPGMRIKFESIL